MDDGTTAGKGLDALYVALQDGTAIDPQVAFDVATYDPEYFAPDAGVRHFDAAARELAEASLANDGPRLTRAASAFLEMCGYEPGFDQAPDRLARLERVLETVRADLRATGLTGELKLARPEWTPNVAVQSWTGDTGWTTGVFSSEAADDLSALVAVAEQARQAVMESLDYQFTGRAWPACPKHGLGTSPEARGGIGVWWCGGDGNGHIVAEIGHWPKP